MKPLLRFLLVMLVVVIIVGLIFRVAQQSLLAETAPQTIPTYDEAVPKGFSALNTPRVLDVKSASLLIEPRPGLDSIARTIVEQACPTNHPTCRLEALHEWVILSIEYTDVLPTRDHIISPEETILYREGNDLTLSILLASMLRAEDIPARVAHTPYISFVEAKILNKPVIVDIGCSGCEIGRGRYRGSNETISWIE